jgi:hypothetical protein
MPQRCGPFLTMDVVDEVYRISRNERLSRARRLAFRVSKRSIRLDCIPTSKKFLVQLKKGLARRTPYRRMGS